MDGVGRRGGGATKGGGGPKAPASFRTSPLPRPDPLPQSTPGRGRGRGGGRRAHYCLPQTGKKQNRFFCELAKRDTSWISQNRHRNG